MTCKFDIAWVGKCKKSVVEGSDFCMEHAKEKCGSCGAQATHECPETGQFVCGVALCDECEHTIYPNGTNGGIGFAFLGADTSDRELYVKAKSMKSHCKKTEQVYKPWYAQEIGDLEKRVQQDFF